MPPKSESNKLADAQIDVIFAAFVKHPPIGGSGHGEMKQDKANSVYRAVHAELVEVVPPVIDQLRAAGVSHKSMQQVDVDTLKRLWKRWIQKYRELKREFQVSSSMRKGQTGLSGDDALPESANKAIQRAEGKWALFARFHAVWGQHARFNDDLVKTSLTPVKAAAPACTPTEGAHQEEPAGEPTQVPDEVSGACGVPGAVDPSTDPVAPAGGGSAVSSHGAGSSKAGERIRRKSAVAAATALAVAVSVSSGDGEAEGHGVGAAADAGPEEESSWDSTIDGGEWLNKRVPGYEEHAARRARHLKRKAAREAAKGGLVKKGKRGVGAKRESVRDRRLAETVETTRAENAKEVERMRGENFSATMREVTAQKVASGTAD